MKLPTLGSKQEELSRSQNYVSNQEDDQIALHALYTSASAEENFTTRPAECIYTPGI